MPRTRKYYVVFRGHRTGIYPTWELCKEQIAGFPRASYASFKTLEEAEHANACGDLGRWKKLSGERWRTAEPGKLPLCVAVDAACSGCPGPVEYRGVILPSLGNAFAAGPFAKGTNNVGEFLAIVAGLRWMENRSLSVPLYSDSRVAIGWVGDRECRTADPQGLDPLIKTELSAALRWLHGPTADKYIPLIRKWNTKEWGETPADYGRK
jgi:ribonuclease HI